MTRIAYLVSSATEITMADGTKHPTGYFAEEALKPYERFVAAGFEVVVVTPDGKAPTADPYGLNWFFHYPDEDKDYLNSVVRTFAFDPEDIRFTLHQSSDLDLAASRRLAQALEAKGLSAAEAHAVISNAAKAAWRQDRRLGDVLADPGYASGLSAAEITEAIAAQRKASEDLAADRKAKLDVIPGFQRPADLRSLTDEELESFDAVFAPGGHGPMVDLVDNPDVARLLVILHERAAPIASLCHGPALLLSAPERPDGQWLFDGYRMTCFTDEEEDQTEPGKLGHARGTSTPP